MKATLYPYSAYPGTRPHADKAVWNWNHILKDEAKKLQHELPNNFNLGTFAPVSAFHCAPMRGYLVPFVKGFLLEVELPPTDRLRTEILEKSHKPIWIAEVVHMVGYYMLCRWCGSKTSDGMFWIHAANAHVHQVGWATQTRETERASGYVLIPPYHIMNHLPMEQWCRYLEERVYGRYTACDGFEKRALEIGKCKFRVHERVETIHDEESFVLMPAIVKRILGRRVLLEYSKADVDKADQIDKDNMWRDMDDDLIYPVGFAQTMGLTLTANKKYKTHVEAIANSIKDGVTVDAIPYSRMDATMTTVYQWTENKSAAGWEENMVCEIIDRLDECQNILKAARVLKVLPDGYLQIGPEGADILNDSFYVHQTSPVLFPAGYANRYNIALQGPKGDNEDVFDWETFLKRTNYNCAPEHLFHEANENDVPYNTGMRMEAIDQNEKMLCPATVKAIKGRLVLVAFDGWAEEYDQLYDFRSNELLPCGWGEMIGHALQNPEQGDKQKELVGEEVEDEEMEDSN